jgi:hypothetical protein
LEAPYYSVTGLIHYSCRISDLLGFSAVDLAEKPDDPIAEFLAALPASQRERLNIAIPELQILIASRLNALEA